MNLLLAIDCSAGACSVAVAEDAEVRAHEALRLARGHAEVLMPMVERVLAEADCTAQEIGVVAATVGPGSFTGMRIGLAAARGLALAVGARTVPVTSLEAIAHAAGLAAAQAADPPMTPLLVALDSKRGDLYAQWFEAGGQAMGDPDVLTAPAAVAGSVAMPGAAAIRVAGDMMGDLVEAAAAAGLEAVPVEGCDVPDARSVAAVALGRLAAGGAGPLRPLYLRPPAVNLPVA